MYSTAACCMSQLVILISCGFSRNRIHALGTGYVLSAVVPAATFMVASILVVNKLEQMYSALGWYQSNITLL